MKRLLLAVLLALALAGLTGCQSLDVIGRDSVRAFGEVLEVAPGLVAAGEGGYALAAPDGSARFFWRGEPGGGPLGLTLRFPAQPFLDAGLDPAKLPAGMLDGDALVIAADLGEDAHETALKATLVEGTPIMAFEEIVQRQRDRIMYHADMDHFGVALDGGNVFEWAKDIHSNDKDIVFVLNPQPFIDAGADPAKVEGWIFAKVKLMEANGRKVEIDKLLKPFDLL